MLGGFAAGNDRYCFHAHKINEKAGQRILQISTAGAKRTMCGLLNFLHDAANSNAHNSKDKYFPLNLEVILIIRTWTYKSYKKKSPGTGARGRLEIIDFWKSMLYYQPVK